MRAGQVSTSSVSQKGHSEAVCGSMTGNLLPITRMNPPGKKQFENPEIVRGGKPRHRSRSSSNAAQYFWPGHGTPDRKKVICLSVWSRRLAVRREVVEGIISNASNSTSLRSIPSSPGGRRRVILPCTTLLFNRSCPLRTGD